LDAKIVGDAAENGDALAKEIYEICGDYLGRGLSILIDLLNPEVIAIWKG
jgi:glucokinase